MKTLCTYNNWKYQVFYYLLEAERGKKQGRLWEVDLEGRRGDQGATGHLLETVLTT